MPFVRLYFEKELFGDNVIDTHTRRNQKFRDYCEARHRHKGHVLESFREVR